MARLANPEVRRIRALRLRAQGLVPGVRDWRSAADVARGMLAMQAQDAAGVRWALSLRAADHPADDAVRAELAAGAVVRNRPSRGTLQVTAPEDLHWMSATLSPARAAPPSSAAASSGSTRASSRRPRRWCSRSWPTVPCGPAQRWSPRARSGASSWTASRRGTFCGTSPR
ncbi:DNA glycosylase AlkZ-like family protein [Tsukamurella soli]|uniref:DNA glycosylase AlkZ-like family protein n=1 Tax=Tsukamurella soli TaxID=644556 RepID=UPI0036241169